jgi:uncharacterized protein YoxC
MTPNEIFFGFITAAFIALVIFLIWLILRIGETMKTANRVMGETDQALREAMTEIDQNLRSLRVITDNISTVTNDIAAFSGSIKIVGDEVKQLSGSVRRIGDGIHGIGTETAATMCGLRAGLATGFEVLLKSLFQQRTSR